MYSTTFSAVTALLLPPGTSATCQQTDRFGRLCAVKADNEGLRSMLTWHLADAELICHKILAHACHVADTLFNKAKGTTIPS